MAQTGTGKEERRMAETAVAAPAGRSSDPPAPAKPWALALVFTVLWGAVCFGLSRLPTVQGDWWGRKWSDALGPELPVTTGFLVSVALLAIGAAASFTWVARRPEEARALAGWFRNFREHLKWYQPGQGTASRRAALGLLGAMAMYGAFQCYDTFSETWDWWTRPIGTVGLVDFTLRWGMVACAGVFVVLFGAVYLGVVNQPKLATFLIEVEGELKKVSWPARHEYWGTSVVVLVTVTILSVYLVVADIVSRSVMDLILRTK